MKRRWILHTLVLLVPVFIASAVAAQSGWKRITNEDGILVSVRENEGKGLPTFRGEGLVEGSILDVLAVLYDDKKHEDWMHNCMQSTVLKRFSETETVMYNRTHAPWPVSDRDVVLKSTTEFDIEKREVWSKFSSITSKLKPEVDNAVRMPNLTGFYRLTYVSDTRTRVVYQVNADPGGMLPEWLAKLSSRDLPLVTLQKLRKQVRETQGKYDDLLTKWVKMFALPVDLQGRRSLPRATL